MNPLAAEPVVIHDAASRGVQPADLPRRISGAVVGMVSHSQPRFKLGRIVATPGALEALENNQQNAGTFLFRHQTGDWGELCDEDKRANEIAVAHEGDPGRQQRVLSSYVLDDGTKIWVITEWDRSSSTILLPEEY